jgi:hypothetical protein
MLLHYLESRNVHIVVNEQYVFDERGDKKDQVIMCIVWWTLAQIQLARRFVSDVKKHKGISCFAVIYTL